MQLRVRPICLLLGGIYFIAGCTDKKLTQTITTYYSNGKVKMVSQLLEGKLTGVTKFYYPNGILRDSSTYLADSLNGISLLYNQNGIQQQRSYYTNGKPAGTEILFDSTGKPAERHIYDESGEIIYINSYYEGKPLGSGMTPLYKLKDTIVWDEKFTGFLRFGYPLKKQAALLIGTLGKDLKAIDRYPLLDTLQIIKQSRDGRFYFAFQPVHAGNNTMGYKFIQPGSPWNAVPQDSLSVDNISGTIHFFVKKTELEYQ